MEDRCVCCGEIIPEGRMVCPQCEAAANERQASMYHALLVAGGGRKRSPKETHKRTHSVKKKHTLVRFLYQVNRK